MFDTIKGIIGDIAAGAIKDQRIALSQEQLGALDLKLREALSENTRLSQHITELEQEKAALRAELNQLRKQLERLQPHADVLPPESERLLVAFANSSRGITSDQAIRSLGMSQASGDYYFDQLEKRRFVHASSGQMGVGWFYNATAAGRDYLAKRGLL